MSIDWDKKLSCKYGDVFVLKVNSIDVLVERQGIQWFVNKESGEHLSKWMPRVYNKKPEPQEGEYWLIKDVHDHERVVYFDGQMFTDGPTCNEAYLDITLVGKMERVEE